MEEFVVPRSVDTRAAAKIITLETTAIVSVIYTCGIYFICLTYNIFNYKNGNISG